MSKYNYYTPIELAALLLELIPQKASISSAIDICCGSWNLLAAAKRHYPEVKITGVDIDPAAHAHCIEGATFVCDDGRSFANRQEKAKQTYDLVLSNPPFGPLSKKKKKYKTAYIKANDLNLRKKPNVKSKSIKRLFYGKKIKFIIINKKWSKIKVDNKVGYVQMKYITTKKIKSKIHTSIPHYKLCSFMDYRCITNTSSRQYKLQKKAYTGSYGIRQVDGRYCIAVGSYYTEKIGTYIDLVLKNGTVIPCILADCKANKDTDGKNQKTADGSLIEFVVDTPKLSKKVRIRGDVAYSTKAWNSKIVKIKIHKNK